ncbi:hypothetical protein GCM10010441_25140 [Kitasatospora paracochleata]|uniref:Immunity protein 35 of polymorphic toxin system n=1 Tax=Kitasatospora paracochleata TaxID=58354 RepID=A0ABT1J1W0_9ACTN|nr:hypothetical protein [Kitasatospora paracochleata]MCP2311071.1 hypothetical protein [Kitasatospora paracochleata]
MTFLQDKVERNDLLRLTVTGKPAPQHFTALVEEVYSSRVFDGRAGSEIRFVGKPAHWGQRPLEVGGRALVFVSRISGRWYEDAWEGDLPIEEIDGVEYALHRVAHERVLGFEGLPEALRRSCRPHPTLPITTCFDLAALEAHLNRLIDQVHPKQGGPRTVRDLMGRLIGPRNT